MRGDLKQLPSQQEQTLGTLDTRIDAMIARRTQAIMDRLDGLLGNRSGSRNRGAHSGEANRETRVNFNEQPMYPREEGATHPVMPPGIIGRWVQRIPEEVLLAADRPRANVLCET